MPWGASRGSLEAPETPTGPMDLDFANSESLLEPPRSSEEACAAPEHVKKPSDSLHGAYVKLPESPKWSQQAPTDDITKVCAAECAERLNK